MRPKATELYSVEIWRDGVREAVVPIMKNEITIGRGSGVSQSTSDQRRSGGESCPRSVDAGE